MELHFRAWWCSWLETRRSHGDGELGRVTAEEHAEALAAWEVAADRLERSDEPHAA